MNAIMPEVSQHTHFWSSETVAEDVIIETQPQPKEVETVAAMDEMISADEEKTVRRPRRKQAIHNLSELGNF
jgi:hypothetical protein